MPTGNVSENGFDITVSAAPSPSNRMSAKKSLPFNVDNMSKFSVVEKLRNGQDLSPLANSSGRLRNTSKEQSLQQQSGDTSFSKRGSKPLIFDDNLTRLLKQQP